MAFREKGKTKANQGERDHPYRIHREAERARNVTLMLVINRHRPGIRAIHPIIRLLILLLINRLLIVRRHRLTVCHPTTILHLVIFLLMGPRRRRVCPRTDRQRGMKNDILGPTEAVMTIILVAMALSRIIALEKGLHRNLITKEERRAWADRIRVLENGVQKKIITATIDLGSRPLPVVAVKGCFLTVETKGSLMTGAWNDERMINEWSDRWMIGRD